MNITRTTMIALLLAATAFAHSGGRDIRGTIVSFDRRMIVVERLDGNRERVPLTPSTTYRVGKAAGEWQSMRNGSRVVVHIAHDGTALEVHLPAHK